MNEEQKQAVADLKIKHGNMGGYLLDRLNELTPQAHESVQNGTADKVNDDPFKTSVTLLVRLFGWRV